MTSYCGLHKSLPLQMAHRQSVKKRCRCGWINRGVMRWVSTSFHTAPGVSVARIRRCLEMLQSITLLYRFPPRNCEAANQVKLTPVCVPLPFTRWSSSRSTSRATRWCTGPHRRGCRGASGLCSRCAPRGRTALSCHSSGKESHMNSKSAPSSMNSRGRTATSKLAKRWRKVGGMWLRVWLRVWLCVRGLLQSLHVCTHVFMFTQFLCAQLACVRAYNSCSQQAARAGLCYVQMWRIEAC